MQLGMIGLGRMGANMARRVIRKGHECVVFDMSPKAIGELVKEKAVGSTSLADLANVRLPTTWGARRPRTNVGVAESSVEFAEVTFDVFVAVTAT